MPPVYCSEDQSCTTAPSRRTSTPATFATMASICASSDRCPPAVRRAGVAGISATITAVPGSVPARGKRNDSGLVLMTPCGIAARIAAPLSYWATILPPCPSGVLSCAVVFHSGSGGSKPIRATARGETATTT